MISQGSQGDNIGNFFYSTSKDLINAFGELGVFREVPFLDPLGARVWEPFKKSLDKACRGLI